MMKNLLINILYYTKIAGKQKKLYWINNIEKKKIFFSIKYFSHQQDRRMFEEARYRI